MRILLSITIFFSSIFTFAQLTKQQEIDSLLTVLENEQTFTEKSNLYYTISEAYAAIDSIKAFDYVYKGISASQNSNDLYGISKGKFTLGGLYFDYGNLQKAEFYYRAADTILSNVIKKDSSYKNLRLWVRTNFNISASLSNQGTLEELDYLKKVIPIAEKIEAYDILAKTNTNLAIQFNNLGAYKKAYAYFLKSGPQYEKIKDYQTLILDRLIFASCLNNLDSTYRMKIELDKVKELLKKSPNDFQLKLYHTIRGEYLQEMRQYNDAIKSYDTAYSIYKKSNVGGNINQLFYDYMKVYDQIGNYKMAKKYANLSLENAKKNKLKLIEIEVLKRLSTYEFKNNEYKNAYEHLLTSMSLNDSIDTKEITKEINRLEVQYKTEKKEREILELKSKNDTIALNLERKKSQNYVLYSVLGIVLFLALLGYLGFRNIKKETQLKIAEINQLKHEQAAKVYNAMLDGQENERKRLAIDLHDGLAGRLSAARIKLEKLFSLNSKKENTQLKYALQSIDDSLSELRDVARDLMPETVLKYGLKAAVEDYCSSISLGVDTIKFILQFYDTEANIPKNTLLTLYRIIQELINNAVKHSEATEVLVQYMVENGKIDVTVEDNGIGFSETAIIDKKGMGLHNLKTRVAYLNGTIDFVSSIGEGTTVHIEI